jgi:hypothetical protein
VQCRRPLRCTDALQKQHNPFQNQHPQLILNRLLILLVIPKTDWNQRAATEGLAQSAKQYDREKWAALLKYDDELARVAGRISPLGQKWLDELAHAYLVLNDKKYLHKIEEKIYAAALAERARSRL